MMAPAADRPFCCPAARGSSQKKAHKQQMSTSYFFFSILQPLFKRGGITFTVCIPD